MDGHTQPVETKSSELPLPTGLVYVTDSEPGIIRRKRGKGFSYQAPGGTRVAALDRKRINALAIPPAYASVWICPLAEGHLQATGLDDRGRKQYRYHPAWSEWRAQVKYGSLAQFGSVLGRLRRKIHADLQIDAGARDFALAAVVFLIDRTALRVGDEAYLRDNGSYGATNLLARHMRLTNGQVRLSFNGKGGKRVVKTLADKRLHRVLHQIGDLPGRHIFSYIDPDGSTRRVHSHEVNAYIAGAIGIEGASAKSFRTWAGTLAAFELALIGSDRLTRKAVAEAAAERLVNTPTVCRTSYIHPEVMALPDLAADDRAKVLESLSAQGDRSLRVSERKLMDFLLRQG
jgi:DNA topoisomerase-1